MVVTVKGRVGYTEAGLKEVMRLLGFDALQRLPEQKKRRGVVTRIFGNPQLIEARVGDELVTVRVRENALFVPGQAVPLLSPAEGSRVWWLGCRPPMTRGRLPRVDWGEFV
jgi:hypothetical protein